MQLNTRLAVAVLACHLTVAGMSLAQDQPAYVAPVLHVPKIVKAPVIDGTINEGEWQQASAFTGVVSAWEGGSPGSPPTAVPEVQQVVWYVGYDDQRLYLAMHSPHAKGTFPKANVKKNDDGALLFEDHVELQFCPSERGKAAENGFGFFKIMVNPRGAFTDEHHFNGTPGTEQLWTCDAEVKCVVAEDHWDLEMAVPFKAFNVKNPNGQTWVNQFVRTDFCGGIYFAGWVGGQWMDWPRFGEMTFDADAPVVQFRRMGDIVNGEVNTLVSVRAAGKKSSELQVRVRVTNADGKELFNEAKPAAVKPGEEVGLTFQKKLEEGLSPRNNLYELRATEKQDDGTEKVLYWAKVPFMHNTSQYWAQYIEPWLKSRPTAGEYGYEIAYYPYFNSLEARVDLDLFGVKKEIQAAKSFLVRVRGKGGEVVANGRGMVNPQLAGNTLINVGELKDGEYEAKLQLLDADGKTLDARTANFQRRHYPWEHNTIGVSDRVIPPYTPIQTEANHLKPWNRDYEVGKAGLLDKVVVGGENILANPMTLIAKQGDQEATLAGEGMKTTIVEGHRVDLQASGKLGNVGVTVDGWMEYDGWYQVKMTLAPPEGTPVAMDSLDMIWDLWPGADTIYVQRGDMLAGGKYGALPAGEGVVWESKDLAPVGGLRGTWAPIAFLGSGDKGLWFLAESDEGWITDDSISCIQAERIKGAPRLRFRLFNKPCNLDKPRTITFAVIAMPVKPMSADWRKTAWGQPGGLDYAHDTCGYRYYGDSVDGYALHSEEDYRRLREFFLDPQKSNPEYAWWEGHYAWKVRNGRPLVLYGSGQMTGMGMEEFKTFSGEWLGVSNPKLSPDNSFKGKTSYGGTVKWETPEQLTPTGIEFTQSQIDCFVWYHKNLVEKCLVNGCWWDNSSISFGNNVALGRAYVRDDGKVQGKSNVFIRRQLTKRLATMGWELGRPPLYLQNMHVDFSFCQVAWHIENDFYIHGVGHDLIDYLKPDVFRALCRIKGGIIPRLHSSIPGDFNYGLAGADPRPMRSIVGLCLLHDVGHVSGGWWVADKMTKLIDGEIGYFDTANCEFIPYWRNAQLVKHGSKDVRCSIYLNRARGRALLFLLNEGDAPAQGDLWINEEALLGHTAHRLYDAEEEVNLGRLYDNAKRQYVPGTWR
ncbi:MAG: hypothetical protein HY318_05450, partial [Armatimonadetes bacterium]|nr:hypothetical protein [Armatimonadota bacterium]